MARSRGRPPLDDLDRMEQEGAYLLARAHVGDRLDPPRAPNVGEVADYMGVSPRTVVAIRAGMRQWRRAAADALGWADTNPIDFIDGLKGWTFEEDMILGRYAHGEISTTEAADLLGRADERELRRWRRSLTAE